MGRLTLRNVFGKARCKKNGTKFCYETDECLYCKHNDEILEKLAHYEDLEEQGRLIELPCSVPVLHGNTLPNSKEEAMERLGLESNKLKELEGDKNGLD